MGSGISVSIGLVVRSGRVSQGSAASAGRARLSGWAGAASSSKHSCLILQGLSGVAKSTTSGFLGSGSGWKMFQGTVSVQSGFAKGPG